ncbi:MAG: SGNH/GDSL hydrolase family protein [Bacteroidota bacterium]
MRNKIIKYLILLIINLFIIFLVIEIGLRIYSGFIMMYDIEMYKYAKKLKRKSNVPGLVHEHIPNSEAELMGVNFKINSLGFRDEELPAEKGKNEYRIFVLGCSNTVGWGVPFDSVFTMLLENKLNSANQEKWFNVINAGIGNYNTTLETILFKERLPAVLPDKVILHYYINDVEIVTPKNTGFIVENSYLAAYLKNKSKYDRFKDQYTTIGEYYKDQYQDTSRGWKEAQNAMLEINRLCGASNIELMVLLQPDLHDLSIDSEQEGCYKKVRQFLEEQNIEFLDLVVAYRDRFENNPKKLWINNDDAHPNCVGHRIIFEELYDHARH